MGRRQQAVPALSPSNPGVVSIPLSFLFGIWERAQQGAHGLRTTGRWGGTSTHRHRHVRTAHASRSRPGRRYVGASRDARRRNAAANPDVAAAGTGEPESRKFPCESEKVNEDSTRPLPHGQAMRTLDLPAAWLSRPEPRPAADLRLFCFPWSGASASAYRAWPRPCPATSRSSRSSFPGTAAVPPNRPSRTSRTSPVLSPARWSGNCAPTAEGSRS